MQREELRRSLRVTSLEHTFEHWQHQPGTETAHTAFLALATRDDCRPLLLCYGGVGNGKSYLAEALVIEWRKRRLYARVTVWSDLTNALRAAIRGEAVLPQDAILANFKQATRLVLDDVGMGGSGTAWEWGQLEEIVCARYRERLPTVICTNLDLKELPERVVSRFADPEVGLIVFNQGADYRRRQSTG